jgi:hypothetical protein
MYTHNTQESTHPQRFNPQSSFSAPTKAVSLPLSKDPVMGLATSPNGLVVAVARDVRSSDVSANACANTHTHAHTHVSSPDGLVVAVARDVRSSDVSANACANTHTHVSSPDGLIVAVAHVVRSSDVSAGLSTHSYM